MTSRHPAVIAPPQLKPSTRLKPGDIDLAQAHSFRKRFPSSFLCQHAYPKFHEFQICSLADKFLSICANIAPRRWTCISLFHLSVGLTCDGGIVGVEKRSLLDYEHHFLKDDS